MFISRELKLIINKHFYQPVWYSIFINPYFISRYGLLKKIKKFAQNDFSDKKILDVGCGIKPYENLFKESSYIGIDIDGGGHKNEDKIVDKFYDGLSIPFPDAVFDVVICTEVMEHVLDPEKLLIEIYRVLKKDGQVFLTMPFVWNEHETPYDFRRFTRYEHKKIFKKANLNIRTIENTTGVFGVCGQLISAFIFENPLLKSKILKLMIAVIVCFPIQIFFLLLDFVFKNSWITLNYSVTATKS